MPDLRGLLSSRPCSLCLGPPQGSDPGLTSRSPCGEPHPEQARPRPAQGWCRPSGRPGLGELAFPEGGLRPDGAGLAFLRGDIIFPRQEASGGPTRSGLPP